MTAAPLVVLAAGGTGGHMYPAEALATALLARGVSVALITDRRGGAFGEKLPAVRVFRIRAGRLGRDAIDRVRGVLEMGVGAYQALQLLKDLRPAAVVGFGGYPSVPTIAAALWHKTPVILHEQNALLGRANRRLAGRAAIIATSFARTTPLPENANIALTGNPVRPGILSVRDIPYTPPAADGPLSLFITGGSQGAHIFSEVVPAAIALLPQALRTRLEIVQQSRPEDIAATREAFAATGAKVELSSFFNDVPARLASCHLAIMRAGASTVSELGVAGRPAILVPYPFATDDHQTANAQAFASGGAGWVIGQRGFTPLVLAERLKAILATPEILVQAAAAARQQGQPDAADRLAQVVIGQIEAGAKSAAPALRGLAV